MCNCFIIKQIRGHTKWSELCLTCVRMWWREPLKRGSLWQPTGPRSSALQLTDWKRKVSQSPRELQSQHTPVHRLCHRWETGHNLNPTLIIKNKKGASHGAKYMLPTLRLAFSCQASQPIRCCNYRHGHIQEERKEHQLFYI